MRKIVLPSLIIAGLLVGATTIASASTAIPAVDLGKTVQTHNIRPVDYYWNHHRYRHRSWNKKYRRWRYYN